MQAIILAAGFGKRLQPITNEIPKSLVKVSGVPLIINALNHLSAHGITETIIVVGHKKEELINAVGHTFGKMQVTYVENPLFEKTNNVYSLYLAMNYIHDDILLLEGDLFYEKGLISAITVENGAECNILASKFNSETMDGTVIECDENNKVLSLIIKREQSSGFDYSNKHKTVNVYRLSKGFIKNKFAPAIELYIKTQSLQSYYELVLGALIYYGNSDVRMVPIEDTEWCEIDDINDLNIANEKFGK